MLEKRAITGFTCGLIFCLLFGYGVVSSRQGNDLSYLPWLEAKHNVYIRKLPQDIYFAGEPVHFKTPSCYERFERELKHNTRPNSSTRLLLRNVKIWLPEIEQIIRKNQLPDDFKYLAVAESNLSNALSHKQAAGFWQFTESTAAELGLTINSEVDERYHPLIASEAACRYFRKAYRVFGNWTSSAASYNRGIAGLQRAYADQQVENFYDLELNDETSRYMYKILALKDLITTPQKYNMTLKIGNAAYIKKIKVDTSISNLVKFSKVMNIPYLTLREYNPWILKNSLTIEKGKTYTILVPYDEIGITDPQHKPADSLKRVENSTISGRIGIDTTRPITGPPVSRQIIF
jgi:membrane-bound lytic murein transglycosylase D